MVDEYGAEVVLRMICTRIAEGEAPSDIARSYGMPWMVMRRWMEDSADRMSQWELAKRCFADGLAYESLRVVRDADEDSVALARLQSETYAKTAGKVSRVEWGGEASAPQGFGAGGITIVIGEVKSPYLPPVKSEGLVIEQRVSDGESVSV